MVGDEAFAIGEQALVDAAVVKRFSDFARLVEYFIHTVGPPDAADREQKRYEERYGSSSRTLDGAARSTPGCPPSPSRSGRPSSNASWRSCTSRTG